MKDWYKGKFWTANGSEHSTSCYDSGRVDRIHVVSYNVNDPCNLGNKSTILIKFGEKDGAQDGNKDRSMIASHSYDGGHNVDAPAGLGCFMSTGSGDRRYRDIVPWANKQDDAPHTISGTPLAYTIWVKESPADSLSEVLTRGNAGCYSDASWSRSHNGGAAGSMCNFLDQRDNREVDGTWTNGGHQNHNGNDWASLEVNLSENITAEYVALVGYEGGSHYPQRWYIQAWVTGGWQNCFDLMTCGSGNDGTACFFYGAAHTNGWRYNEIKEGPDVYPERYKKFDSRVTSNRWRIYYDNNAVVSNGYMLLSNWVMWG